MVTSAAERWRGWHHRIKELPLPIAPITCKRSLNHENQIDERLLFPYLSSNASPHELNGYVSMTKVFKEASP